MNPLKAKSLLPDLVKDTEIPLQLAEDLTDFFWDYTHKTLTSLDHYHIMIPHLGTFNIKGNKKLTEEIDKLEKTIIIPRIRIPRKRTLYAIYMDKEKRITKLKKLRDQCYKELSDKKLNRELRKQIRYDKENLEEQKTDNRRTDQHSL